MEIEQLLDETAEPQLASWLRKWPNALEALNNIADLFVGLQENCILGQVSEQVSISGPVHIGKGTQDPSICDDSGAGDYWRERKCSIAFNHSEPGVHRLRLCRGAFSGCKAINLP